MQLIEIEAMSTAVDEPGSSERSGFHGGGSEFHDHIAQKDPLAASDVLKDIPRLNRLGDVGGLVELLLRMVPHPVPSANWTYAEAAAAMRDVGLVLGSIRRHGEEPLQICPELTSWLIQSGQITDLPPRDTLLHYTIWNPDTALRTYTDLVEEVELIRAVKMAFPALEEAIQSLLPLFDLSLRSKEFGDGCCQVFDSLKWVRDAAVHTFRKVDRQVFVTEIRPYFEPIEVAGNSFLGPGAVAMPLFVFDHLLWSASLTDPQFTAFKEDYLPVTLPYLRRLYQKHLEEGCLLDRVLDQLQPDESQPHPVLSSNLEKLSRLFGLLNGFRSVHLRMAQQAYDESHGPFEKGSGGYRPDMLAHIFRLSRQAQERLQCHVTVEGEPSRASA